MSSNPSSPSDHRAFQNAKSQIKEVLTQKCQPPYDPKGFGENLKSVTAGLVRNSLNIDDMDNLDRELDRVFDLVESYEEVSMTTSMQPQHKKRLKEIAARKGVTMGEVIEEMIGVYDTEQ